MPTRGSNEEIHGNSCQIKRGYRDSPFNEEKKMEETTNTAEQTQETSQQEKTFTQAELDAIVQARVAKEREGVKALKEKADKFDQMEEANKSELQKAQEKAAQLQDKISKMEKAAEATAMRQKVATEKGVPADLLTGETEEACKAQADKILAFAQGNGGYPAVKDAGEVQRTGKASTAEQFEQWAKQTFK